MESLSKMMITTIIQVNYLFFTNINFKTKFNYIL